MNSASIFYITKLSNGLNGIFYKIPELKAYLESLKGWKKFSDKDLKAININETTMIGEKSVPFNVGLTKEAYFLIINYDREKAGCISYYMKLHNESIKNELKITKTSYARKRIEELHESPNSY